MRGVMYRSAPHTTTDSSSFGDKNRVSLRIVDWLMMSAHVEHTILHLASCFIGIGVLRSSNVRRTAFAADVAVLGANVLCWIDGEAVLILLS